MGGGQSTPMCPVGWVPNSKQYWGTKSCVPTTNPPSNPYCFDLKSNPVVACIQGSSGLPYAGTWDPTTSQCNCPDSETFQGSEGPTINHQKSKHKYDSNIHWMIIGVAVVLTCLMMMKKK